MKNAPSLFIASAVLAAALAGCNFVDGGSDSDSEADYTSSDSTTYMRLGPSTSTTRTVIQVHLFRC
jgi:hypothetical protein